MLSRTLSTALLLLLAPTAFASPIVSGLEYRIHDHPDGGLAPPTYALRLDGLDGGSSHNFSFSADTNGAHLTIRLDDLAKTLTIEGTVYGGRVSGHDYDNEQLWSVSFVYEGVMDLGDALEATPGGGSGTISALGDGGNPVPPFGLDQTFSLVDKSNESGLAFRLDFGHRVDDDDTITGYGWLTHDGISPRVVAQDWLFTLGDPIQMPEPSTALLIGLGMLALVAQRMHSTR